VLCDSAPDADTWLVLCLLKLLDLLFNNARRASAVPGVAGPCVHDSGIFFCKMHDNQPKNRVDSDHRHGCQPIVTLVHEQIETHLRGEFRGDDNASANGRRHPPNTLLESTIGCTPAATVGRHI
jgi:hypothetical protein